MNLYIISSGTSLTVKDSSIIVIAEGRTETIPIALIDSVCIDSCAEISSRTICKLACHGINISFTSKYDIVCRISNGNIFREKKQFILNDDNDFRIKMSRKLIDAKVNNQFRFLDEICGYSPLSHISEDLSSIDEIMGYEGSSARKYFQLFKELIPDELNFSERKKRTATDPVNSMLNYVYSMLYRKYSIMIQEHGLDPHIGFMHEIKNGHNALASDLMEPFRSVISDKTVYSILKTNVSTDDFSTDENGFCIISSKIKRELIEKFDDICASYSLTQNGFENTLEGKMKEQLCSYIKAIDNHDHSLFVPYFKEAA